MKENIAQENFKNWNNALQTKDPQKVANFYTLQATFLPTMSPEFKRGRVEAEEYFKHFLEKNPIGKIVIDEVQTMGPSCYLHSGFYNFEIDDGLGGRKIIEARFSFVWIKDEKEEWKILHHHSSVKP